MMAGDMAENLTKQKIISAQWMMRDAVRFWTWERILEEVQKLAQHEDISCNSMMLSSRSQQALSAVEELIVHRLKYRAQAIAYVLPPRPGFRDSWKNDWLQVKQTTSHKYDRAHPETSLPLLFLKDRLDFCLTAMVLDPLAENNPDRAPWYDYSMLFANLDDYLRDCEKKGKKKEFSRLDGVLYALYSDLSAIHGILALVRLRRPYARRRDFDENQNKRNWAGLDLHQQAFS
jgi:hypothetical protein